MRSQVTTVSEKIMRRVRALGRGEKVFSPKDFFDLGSRSAVDQALSRLAKAGALRRIGRGLYDWPRTIALLKKEAPAELHEVVDALARRDAIEVMPDYLVAANSLGLTNAVPAKMVYLTSGRSKTINAGGWKIEFKHASPKLMSWEKSSARSLVQAIYWLGRDRANDSQAISILSRRTSKNALRSLLRDRERLPWWAQKTALAIASQGATAA
jgi:predicted transcriptional regulator of viral defense system